MKPYKIVKPDGVIITVCSPGEQNPRQYIFRPEDGLELEVEGHTMWAISENDRRETFDDPVVYEEMGWITPA